MCAMGFDFKLALSKNIELLWVCERIRESARRGMKNIWKNSLCVGTGERREMKLM